VIVMSKSVFNSLGSLVLMVSCAITTLACTSLPSSLSAESILASKSGSETTGLVRFTQMGKDIEAEGTIRGLKPNQEHGFHIHDKGDCSSPDGMSAGGHFNPESNPHAHHTSATHHAGDLPNLKADIHGVATFRVTLHGLSLAESKLAITGHALIVHANPDDYASQPAGNAGPRIACGLIVLQNRK
jgi:superoxide dismutase, Cu-Zn family